MGRDVIRVSLPDAIHDVSIHSPRMGRDDGETAECQKVSVSIHSPRMGRDKGGNDLNVHSMSFNPLSPHGERQAMTVGIRWVTQFQSTLPAWGETKKFFALFGIYSFNPLSPHGERQPKRADSSTKAWSFNPLSPHGERRRKVGIFFSKRLFQSTLPAWGETLAHGQVVAVRQRFQSTLPAWGETPPLLPPPLLLAFQSTLPAWGETHAIGTGWFSSKVSIHSPRMGRDGIRGHAAGAAACFNPLSPHGERLSSSIRHSEVLKFQSTLPAWGETVPFFQNLGWTEVSIHSPRMGRDNTRKCICKYISVSIHSPRMGRDAFPDHLHGVAWFQSTLPAWGETLLVKMFRLFARFQSTLPAWGETWRRCSDYRATISFQSTLPAWGETRGHLPSVRIMSFNPLSPHGERPVVTLTGLMAVKFQSTLPAWGETRPPSRAISWAWSFNPLSPHGERLSVSGHFSAAPSFNPLSPHGERPRQYFRRFTRNNVSIHSPRMGRDIVLPFFRGIKMFQSTLPAWGETKALQRPAAQLHVSIHSPRMGRDRDQQQA